MLANTPKCELEISIVLPLYQPKGDWAEQFLDNQNKLKALLPRFNLTYIAVHDGPTVAELKNRFASIQALCPDILFYDYEENRGKGYALRYGVSRATAPYTIVMDFDFPFELKNIQQLIEELYAGSEVVTGRRTSQYFSILPFKRKIISRIYSFCNKLFFDLPVNDTQSGLKGFNQNGKAVFLQTSIDQFLIDTEFLLRATKRALSIKVIDLHLRQHVSFSDFDYKVLRKELRNLLSLLRLQHRLPKEKHVSFGPLYSTSIKMTETK
ncbi:glycosyltransferase family 2 protein [Flavisolibacter nicotianae]|uniref:glycosyltransferase family 2 protein n=1 Tax=Flavisolibacter nicotianae TaxID=2364882 RepID=UPI000EB02EF8|nr:glycosyltransferase family 2 protein [Flavisolibacter nicotianae]